MVVVAKGGTGGGNCDRCCVESEYDMSSDTGVLWFIFASLFYVRY